MKLSECIVGRWGNGLDVDDPLVGRVYVENILETPFRASINPPSIATGGPGPVNASMNGPSNMNCRLEGKRENEN